MSNDKSFWARFVEGLLTKQKADTQDSGSLPQHSTFGALRRTFNQGVGWMVLSTVCFAGAIVLAGHEFLGRIADNAALRKDSQVLVQASHAKRRDEAHIGLVAALLGHPNSVDQPGSHTWPQHVEALLDQLIQGWQETKVPVQSSSLFEECPRKAAAESSYERAFDWGPAWCLSTEPGQVRAVVRSTLASSARLAGTLQPVSATSDDVLEAVPPAPPVRDDDARMRLGYVAAAADVLDSVMSEPPPSVRLGPGHIEQVFFVSIDGNIALWSERPDEVKHGFEARPTRQWGAASYLEAFMWGGTSPGHSTHQTWPRNDEDYHVSPYYIDYLGSGLVRTYCRAVYEPQQKRRFLGAMCVDYHPPWSVVREQKAGWWPTVLAGEAEAAAPETTSHATSSDAQEQDQPSDPHSIVELRSKLFDFLPVCVRGDSPVEIGSCASNTYRAGDARGARPLPTWALKGVTVPVASKGATSEFLRAGTTPAGDPFYFVLMERAGADRLGVFMVPRSPDSASGQLSALFLLFGGAVWSLVAGARSAARAGERATRGAILRALHVGVLEVDESGRIIGANDRAEEILQRTLPKFGTSEVVRGDAARSGACLEALLDPMVVSSIDELTNGEEATPVPAGWIKVLRSYGRSSFYFARLRARVNGKSVWLRVYGSPVFESRTDSRRRVVGTFGVVEPVSKETEAWLDMTMSRAGPPQGSSDARQMSMLAQALGKLIEDGGHR